MNDFRPPYPQQPYPPQPPYQYGVVQPRNGIGTAGFVLGLVGLVFSVIPFVGVIAWPLVIVGLVLSIIGSSRAHKGWASNGGLAAAGIACSAIGLGICVLMATAFGNAFGDREPTRGASSAGPTTTASAVPTTTSAPSPVRSSAEAAPVTEPEPGTVADGKYEVGVDIEPGQYKTAGPPEDSVMELCFWSRTSDDSGDFNAIIASEMVPGPGSVTVKAGEFVKFNGGCTWKATT